MKEYQQELIFRFFDGMTDQRESFRREVQRLGIEGFRVVSFQVITIPNRTTERTEVHLFALMEREVLEPNDGADRFEFPDSMSREL